MTPAERLIRARELIHELNILGGEEILVRALARVEAETCGDALRAGRKMLGNLPAHEALADWLEARYFEAANAAAAP